MAGAALAAAWLAWSYYDSRYPSWEEEVQLSDGRVVVVRQKRQYFDHYGTNQSWVTFSLPEMGGEQTWYSHLRPQRIDVHQGKVYVFGAPRGQRQFQYYHYPRHWMVAFVWDGDHFRRIGFMQVPPELRQKENVYRCVPDPRRRLFTLKDKQENWCPATGDRGQFTQDIDLGEYVQLANEFARMDGGKPLTD